MVALSNFVDAQQKDVIAIAAIPLNMIACYRYGTGPRYIYVLSLTRVQSKTFRQTILLTKHLWIKTWEKEICIPKRSTLSAYCK